MKEVAKTGTNSGSGQGFNDSLERLRQIVEELEQNDLDLEKGVKLYKEACACVRRCRRKLTEARNELESQKDMLLDVSDLAAEAAGAGAVMSGLAAELQTADSGDDKFTGIDEIPF